MLSNFNAEYLRNQNLEAEQYFPDMNKADERDGREKTEENFREITRSLLWSGKLSEAGERSLFHLIPFQDQKIVNISLVNGRKELVEKFKELFNFKFARAKTKFDISLSMMEVMDASPIVERSAITTYNKKPLRKWQVFMWIARNLKQADNPVVGIRVGVKPEYAEEYGHFVVQMIF